MYCHGYGCKESKGTAFRLYSIVYDDNLKHFLKGKNANFADAALRMGNVYAKGIGRETDIPTAYSYYLQAGYAAKLRSRDNYFGDATVVKNIRKAMEEMKEQLPKDFFKEYVDYGVPFLFTKLASENNRCSLSHSMNAEGRIELTVKRIPTKSVPKPDAILVTIPQLSFCARTVKASFTLDEDAKIWFKTKRSRSASTSSAGTMLNPVLNSFTMRNSLPGSGQLITGLSERRRGKGENRKQSV